MARAKKSTPPAAAAKAAASKSAAKKRAAAKAAPPPVTKTPRPPIVGPTPPVVITVPPVVPPVPPIGVIGKPVKVVTGASSLVGSLLLQEGLRNLDVKTRSAVVQALAGVLPQVLTPGTVGSDRTVGAQQLAAVVSSAAVSAAGLDLAATPNPPPPILWDNGSSRLIVALAGVTATLGTGLIELTIPVSCDQVLQATVTVTFVTGAPDAPSGGVATTEDHPRGPAAVVEIWHEALIAFAWHTVLLATAALAAAVGTDTSGGRLITAGLAISPEGLTVTPMAQHSFLRTSVLP
jgi:hypothetical protein